MRAVLFYWSRGAEVRREIVLHIWRCNAAGTPCFMNQLAKRLGLTHPGVKKHLDLLVEHGFVEQVNPGGKPIYLRLTVSGKEVAREFSGEGQGKEEREA